MHRIGRELMLVGFLLTWPLPILGVVLMVVGAISEAIRCEAAMLPAEIDDESAPQPAIALTGVPLSSQA